MGVAIETNFDQSRDVGSRKSFQKERDEKGEIHTTGLGPSNPTGTGTRRKTRRAKFTLPDTDQTTKWHVKSKQRLRQRQLPEDKKVSRESVRTVSQGSVSRQ